MNNHAVIHAIGLTKVFRDFWHRARVRAVNDLDLLARNRGDPGLPDELRSDRPYSL